jgi:hypothetical protein
MAESEYKRLQQQIDLEREAAQRGLTGLSSGSARHAFITARMMRMAQYIQQLKAQGKHEEARALLLNDDLWIEEKE